MHENAAVNCEIWIVGPGFAGGGPGANIEDGSLLIINWSSGSLGRGLTCPLHRNIFIF